MLLPEYISPEDSLYYNGAIILNYLREYKKHRLYKALPKGK